MTSLDKEWPNFDGVPEDDALISARPRGQKLARYVWWDGEVREADSLSVHYYANALHYGTAVFEGIRGNLVRGGEVLDLDVVLPGHGAGRSHGGEHFGLGRRRRTAGEHVDGLERVE